jgi:hypothetical protein
MKFIPKSVTMGHKAELAVLCDPKVDKNWGCL